jgi:ATP-dependent Clp protease ATP-binding subunit ClpC
LGREAEIEMVIETLCRRFKPNPVLIGPAGVGKTAIVEGLAQRIVDGDVPDALRDSRLLAVQVSGLVAGVGEHGQGEYMRRVTTLIEEASEDGVILFIDEMHSMVGVGGQQGTTDVASLLKPALARGDIACIAATTDPEYRQYIEPDGALERRFQPIHVQELSPEQTFVILSDLRDEIAGAKNVRVHDDVLRWIVGFAHEFVPNRYFPDKGVDLLDQCTAHAVAHRKAEVDLDTARIVAERLVGMPASLPERLEKLEQVLDERQILSAEDKATLIGHLSVTMRGLDLSPARPNAVMLLMGEAVAHTGQLSEALAATLFGSPDRVVAIDFSRMTQSHDITMLIGAPPGYVGYSDTLPIHRVAQLQWCVLRCDNIDVTHPNTLTVLAQTLATGVISDAQGKKIYLKNAVVLMTASIGAPSIRRRGKGLSRQEATVTAGARDMYQAAREVLGSNLVDQCDLVCHQRPGGTESSLRAWITERLLPQLATRYSTIAVNIEWDDTVVDWLLSGQGAQSSRREVEEQISRVLNPQLVQNLPAIDGRSGVRCVVSYAGDKIVVRLCPTAADHE